MPWLISYCIHMGRVASQKKTNTHNQAYNLPEAGVVLSSNLHGAQSPWLSGVWAWFSLSHTIHSYSLICGAGVRRPPLCEPGGKGQFIVCCFVCRPIRNVSVANSVDPDQTAPLGAV